MANIHTIRVRISGRWRDAWIYKENLLLWTRDGTLLHVPLAHLRSKLFASFGHHVAVAADYLLFRNDWKRSSQFQNLIAIESVRSALFEILREGSAPEVFDIGEVDLRTTGTEKHSGYVLDVAVHGNRVYSASDEGLFETEFNPAFPNSNNPTIPVFQNSATSVCAKGGIVAASAGESGLMTRKIEFGHGKDWWRVAKKAKLNNPDEYSQAVSFSSYNLLNYKGDSAPRILRSHVESRQPDGRGLFEQIVVTDYDPPMEISSALEEAFKASGAVHVTKGHERSRERPLAHENEATVTTGDLRVVGNSNYKLLSLWNEGCAVANVSMYHRKPITVRRNVNFTTENISKDIVESTLTTQPLYSGFLLEGFDFTGLITERGSYRLIDTPRIRIRSFPNSIRYQDCFIAVDDDHLELVGFVELPG